MKKDVLTAKLSAQSRLANAAQNAISVVTRTIDELTSISNAISENVAEINDYQSQLDDVKTALLNEKGHNDKMIAKFKSLID